MDDCINFGDLLTRARSGDPSELQRFVSQCEPLLLRAIRRRRRSQRAQSRIFYETVDCLQSVLTGFYRKVADQSHSLEITSLDSLKRLLLKMSRDKLVDYERRSFAAKRPMHSDTLDALTDEGGLTPSVIASQREELNAVSDGLSETEKRILELTGDGHSTEEVACLVEGRSGRSIRRFLKQLRERFWK